MRRFAYCAALTGLISSACLDTIAPPPPSPQATVGFQDRVFLASDSMSGTCSDLYLITGGSAPPTSIITGQPLQDATVPHNCFVEIDRTNLAAALPVERYEVTNLQYQLCIDSGACREPDPSEVNKAEVCRSEDEFDDCPIVGVSVAQASDYCEWLGRRLPSGLEHALIRQSAIFTTDGSFPTEIPLLPHTNDLPNACDDAITANGGCGRPFPVFRTDGAIGAASGDVLRILPEKAGPEPSRNQTLHDLVGNVAELLADLALDQRGNATGLPWFCAAALPSDGQCPPNRACVRGRVDQNGTVIADAPVCVAHLEGRVSGFRPVIVGASFFARLVDGPGTSDLRTLSAREAAGVFARRELRTEDPETFGETDLGQRIGFRCVGQRASANGGGIPEFNDRMTLIPRR